MAFLVCLVAVAGVAALTRRLFGTAAALAALALTPSLLVFQLSNTIRFDVFAIAFVAWALVLYVRAADRETLGPHAPRRLRLCARTPGAPAHRGGRVRGRPGVCGPHDCPAAAGSIHDESIQAPGRGLRRRIRPRTAAVPGHQRRPEPGRILSNGRARPAVGRGRVERSESHRAHGSIEAGADIPVPRADGEERSRALSQPGPRHELVGGAAVARCLTGLFPATFAAGGRRGTHADRRGRGRRRDRVQQRVAALRVGDPAVLRSRRRQPAHARTQPPGPDRSGARAGRRSCGAADPGRGDCPGRAVAYNHRARPRPPTGPPPARRRRHRPPHGLDGLRPRRSCRSLCEVLHGVPEICQHATSGSADRQHVLQPAGRPRGVLAREASGHRVRRTGCPRSARTSPTRTTSRWQTACGGNRIVCRRCGCADIRARSGFAPRSSGGPSSWPALRGSPPARRSSAPKTGT